MTQSVAAQSPALAAAPALPGPYQGLTHSDAESRWHPFKAVVQCNWTTVCCFDTPPEVEVVPAKISEDQVFPKIHSKAGVCKNILLKLHSKAGDGKM